jgi:hypothetical protein
MIVALNEMSFAAESGDASERSCRRWSGSTANSSSGAVPP